MKLIIDYRPKPEAHPLRGRMGFDDRAQFTHTIKDHSDIEKYLKAIRNDHGHDCVIRWFTVEV